MPVLWSIAESREIEARTAEPIDDSTILTDSSDSSNIETFENEDDTYEANSSDEYEPMMTQKQRTFNLDRVKGQSYLKSCLTSNYHLTLIKWVCIHTHIHIFQMM